MSNENKAPILFWVISSLGLLWNLMGGYNFFAEYGYWKNPDSRSALPAEYIPMYDITPGWMYVIFAIAVLTGILGCIGLLMRKRWCTPLFTVSLIAVVIQMGYWLLGIGALEKLGPSTATMPAMVIGVAMMLLYYARRAEKLGIID